jgi:hypothetical protein
VHGPLKQPVKPVLVCGKSIESSQSALTVQTISVLERAEARIADLWLPFLRATPNPRLLAEVSLLEVAAVSASSPIGSTLI